MNTTHKIFSFIPELNRENIDKNYLDSLEEYYQSIKYLSENGLGIEFNNKDQNHGALVMSTLFSSAKNDIRIFTGKFDGEICDKEIYINEILNAINKGVNVTVIFENDPNLKSKCYLSLIDLDMPNLILFQLKNDYKIELEQKFQTIKHFTVIDDKSFRYETDTQTYKAFCNFDDKNNSEILISNFEKLRQNSKSITAKIK